MIVIYEDTYVDLHGRCQAYVLDTPYMRSALLAETAKS